MTTETAPLQSTIDELKAEAVSTEDLAYIESLQSELDQERHAALGELASTKLPVLVELANGTIVTRDEAEKDIHGDNPTQAPRRA